MNEGEINVYPINEEARKQLQDRFEEQSASQESGGEQDMSENNYDVFLKDIKDDLREREARNEKRYERIHEELLQGKVDSEMRDEQFRAEMKEREGRLLKAFDETKQDVKDIRSDNKTLLYTNIAGWIAMIIGVAAIVVTFITAK